MGEIIGTLFVGLVVGAIARFLLPGEQKMGWILTVALGIAGSFLAGFVGQALGWYQVGQPAGWIGSVVGAVVASMTTRLDRATGVIPLAIVVGLLMIGLNLITNVWVAAPFLVLLGALCGYLIVPMNALLQHRGHNLMGAGRSIAVQNFNEQACILALGALYAGMTLSLIHI